MDAPTVAAITLHPTGGGIAAVSELLWRVVRDEWGERTQLLTMFDHESRPATFAEKARFAASLTRSETLGRTDWILFTHLALAKIQKAVPFRFRRPYAVFLHGIEAWNELTSSEKETLARADLRIANSHYTAARIMKAHPDVGPIVPCPLALPTFDTAETARREDRSTRRLGPRVVLTVGRMNRCERYKGHDQLIDAWPAVLESVANAELVIVGGGDDTPRLMKKAAASPARRHIHFTGFLPKASLAEIYRTAALFALPSRAEGFGLVYLEAMAHRLACIGSIHDAAGEVIADGTTGRLVDQDDPASLARTVSALLLDDEERRRMGEAGYCRLVGEFSLDRFRERVSALLHTALPAAASAAV